ncbi:putative UDP-rhamnose:rhamnosyltransferase 1 [Iris pallida]|uniref:UDP-rhamnose:rhamnosyltransferase 1 n=1 Tax=Iris pallida TaxID=29817 RepID=A0AAX6EPZ5_IRIPA|nr:putative UDP-rhamnose:rhamnosyltransferase 1 [Iris pallida]
MGCFLWFSLGGKVVAHGAGWLRGFIANYGVPLMVLVWTGVSYIPSSSVPKGIPRRLFSPNPWSPGAYENWTVIKVLYGASDDGHTFPVVGLRGATIHGCMTNKDNSTSTDSFVSTVEIIAHEFPGDVRMTDICAAEALLVSQSSQHV